MLMFTALPDAVTSCELYPIELKTSVGLAEGELILKEPSFPVCVETRVPFTVTVTFETAVPFLDSVTLPVITFCANAEKAVSMNKMTTGKIFEILSVVFLIMQHSILVYIIAMCNFYAKHSVRTLQVTPYL